MAATAAAPPRAAWVARRPGRPLPLLPLLLLAVAALLAAPRPAAAAPADIPSFMPPLKGRTITCARYLHTSDGFVRWAPGAPGKAKADAARDGQIVRLGGDDVIGYHVDTLNWLADKAKREFNTSVNLEFVYYQVPKAVSEKPGLSSPEVLEHVATKFGCVLESLQVKTDRALLVNFMQPNMPFGYILVAPGPKPRASTLADTILNFLKPFTWQVWVTILGLWLVSSAALLFFENREEFGEYGNRAKRRRCGHGYDMRPKGYKAGLGDHSWPNKLGFSAFTTWLTFTSQHFITPVSAAGRLYTMVLCFVCLGLVASYTANLASIFTTAALPVQTVNSIGDMIHMGARVCVKNSKTHLKFMKTVYPQVKLEVVEGDEPEVLDAVTSGRCLAGISSNAHMSYFLSTNQSWCDLTFVGQPLNFGYYSIAFSKSKAMSPQVAAINVLLTDAIERSELHEFHVKNFPDPDKREVCDSSSDIGGSNQSLSLSITQVAGLFLVAGLTLVASFVLYFTADARRRRREWEATGIGAPQKLSLRSLSMKSSGSAGGRSRGLGAAGRGGANGAGAGNGSVGGGTGRAAAAKDVGVESCGDSESCE